MANLGKDPTSGHLIKNPNNGHLAIDCQGSSSSSPLAEDPCAIQLDSAGGDDGLDETYNFPALANAQTVFFNFIALSQEDQLLVYIDGGLAYDTGCIGAATPEPCPG